MLVGHIGAGLLAKRIAPRLNLGVALFAALFADILLWALVLAGVESVGQPQVAGGARFFTFVFPYSHGLVASIAWTALAAVAGWFLVAPGAGRSARVAGALALAVLSHFVLDLLVHVPDLPLVGGDSARIGLGLWRLMPVALVLELLLAGVALAFYLRSVRPARAKGWIVAGVVAATAALTAAGPYLPGAPPPAAMLAAPSLATLVVVVALGFLAEGSARVIVPARELVDPRR